MKERPVIFNGEMVRALLDGRKTQTRRVIKLSHERGMVNPVIRGRNGEISSVSCRLAPMLCPFGQVGDQLWVRETFMKLTGTGIEATTGKFEGFAYRADTPTGSYGDEIRKEYGLKWTPSLHMPRKACRILLEITALRVERLKDISQYDAIAEGGPPSHPSINAVSRDYGFPDFSRSWFAQTWQHIYGEESWSANPWVWVIEFKRVEVRDASK